MSEKGIEMFPPLENPTARMASAIKYAIEHTNASLEKPSIVNTSAIIKVAQKRFVFASPH